MESKYMAIPRTLTFKDFDSSEMKSMEDELLTQLTENIEFKIFNLLKERLFELKDIKVDRISDLEKYKGRITTTSSPLEGGSVKFDTFFDETLLLTIIRDFKVDIKNFNGDQPTTLTTGFKYY